MLKHLLVPVALLLALPGLGFAAEPTFEEVASRQLREATAGDVPGVAVLVARDGKIVFQGGFGMADVAKKEPITPATKFRIGSVSKQFTAAAILKLAEQGKLSLDDSLAKYYPDFPGAADITLRQLLTHTSGVHSYTEKPGVFQRVPEFIEPAKLIEWFRDDKPDFAPGKGFHYSNSGYFLAGEIVGKVSGKPLGDYLRETFFEPLAMKDTGIYVNASPPAGMARGYAVADDKVEPALDWDMSWAGGAGAIYSTVGDLYRWNEGLFGGRVLSEATFKAATTPVVLPEGVDGMNYGYGLMMYQVKRLPAVGHGGGLQGWSSDLLRLPEQRCTVVVLANSLPASEMNPFVISRALAGTLLAEEIAKLPQPEEDKSVDPKTFAAFAGRYDYTSAIMTVTVEKDGLYAQLTDQPKNRIFPKAKDTFFWKGVDAEVVFLRDEQGRRHRRAAHASGRFDQSRQAGRRESQAHGRAGRRDCRQVSIPFRLDAHRHQRRHATLWPTDGPAEVSDFSAVGSGVRVARRPRQGRVREGQRGERDQGPSPPERDHAGGAAGEVAVPAASDCFLTPPRVHLPRTRVVSFPGKDSHHEAHRHVGRLAPLPLRKHPLRRSDRHHRLAGDRLAGNRAFGGRSRGAVWHLVRSGADKGTGYVEAAWNLLMRTFDAGNMADDSGWPLRIITLLVTLGGIFIVSTLIGIITSGMEAKHRRDAQGSLVRHRARPHADPRLVARRSSPSSPSWCIANENQRTARGS